MGLLQRRPLAYVNLLVRTAANNLLSRGDPVADRCSCCSDLTVSFSGITGISALYGFGPTYVTVTVPDFSVTLTADNLYTVVVPNGMVVNLSGGGAFCVDGDYYFDLVVSLRGGLSSILFPDGLVIFSGLQIGALPGCINEPGSAGPFCIDVPGPEDTGFIIFTADENPLLASGTTSNTITSSSYPSPTTAALAFGGEATYSFAGGVCGNGSCNGTIPAWEQTHDICPDVAPCVDETCVIPTGFDTGTTVYAQISGFDSDDGYHGVDGTRFASFDLSTFHCSYYGTWIDDDMNVWSITIDCQDGAWDAVFQAPGLTYRVPLTGTSQACCVPCGLTGTNTEHGLTITVTVGGCS